MRKTRLYELYALSFYEPMDVIEVIDSEVAEIIKRYKGIENCNMLIRDKAKKAGIGYFTVKQLTRIKERYKAGEKVLIKPRRIMPQTLDDDVIIKMIEEGKNYNQIAHA